MKEGLKLGSDLGCHWAFQLVILLWNSISLHWVWTWESDVKILSQTSGEIKGVEIGPRWCRLKTTLEFTWNQVPRSHSCWENGSEQPQQPPAVCQSLSLWPVKQAHNALQLRSGDSEGLRYLGKPTQLVGAGTGLNSGCLMLKLGPFSCTSPRRWGRCMFRDPCKLRFKLSPAWEDCLWFPPPPSWLLSQARISHGWAQS